MNLMRGDKGAPAKHCWTRSIGPPTTLLQCYIVHVAVRPDNAAHCVGSNLRGYQKAEYTCIVCLGFENPWVDTGTGASQRMHKRERVLAEVGIAQSASGLTKIPQEIVQTLHVSVP